VIHRPRNILKAVLLALAAALMLTFSGTAIAASAKAKKPAPCWKVLINDWYDGRIDGTYPIHCYREALNHLPTDVDTYSSARDDIRQALQQRITQGKKGGGGSGGAGTSGGSGGSNPTGGGGGNGSGGGSNASGGPIGGVIDSGRPSSADSVPVPLIVLGAVALLLMAAGAAGFVARRQRTRKLQLASAEALPQRPGGSPPERN
jgi:hypothetical protein